MNKFFILLFVFFITALNAETVFESSKPEAEVQKTKVKLSSQASKPEAEVQKAKVKPSSQASKLEAEVQKAKVKPSSQASKLEAEVQKAKVKPSSQASKLEAEVQKAKVKPGSQASKPEKESQAEEKESSKKVQGAQILKIELDKKKTQPTPNIQNLELVKQKNQTDSRLPNLQSKIQETETSGSFILEEVQGFERELSSKNVKRIRIQRDDSFKVPESKTAPKKRKRLNLKAIEPSSSGLLYYQSGSDEAELEQVMIEEERQLYKLLKQERTAGLTLRLGSLYVDRSRLITFKIQSDHDERLKAFKEGARASKPYLNLKPAQVYNKKSLKLFKDFIENYPRHKRMDEVLFFLGFNFYQLENKKEGIKYYEQLEQRFPRSFYLYEARFQLGEHYYQLRSWKNSLKYYSLVAKNKNGKFYFYALYKMAWSLYKMNRISQGLSILQRIILEGRRFQGHSDRDQILTFTKEAVLDLVLFYTYSKQKAENAKSFFIDLLGEEQAWPLINKLAYAYRDTGQTRSLLIVFQSLIDNNPSGARAFDYKYQMVEAIYNTGRLSNIIRIINEWVKGYGPNSAWFVANQSNRSLIKKSLKLQEVTIRDYALKNHQTYRKTRSASSKNLSLNLYKFYFDTFDGSGFSDQMYFWNAELLFDSKRYIAAVKAYEEVISRFPKSKYAQAAYLNQVLAFEKTLPKEKEIQKIVGKETQPVEMPRATASFLKVANRYIKKFPRAQNSPSVLYTIAAMHYRFNQFDLATQFFKQLSEQYSTHSLASNVGSVLLDIYVKNNDYKALEELALKLSKSATINKELVKEVRSILEQISFKKAQDVSLKNKYQESALLYEKFGKTYPASPLAVTSFYNAGLNFEKHGDILKALAMYSVVLTYKKQSKVEIRKNSQKFIAVLYEKLGFYKKSAQAYVAFAKSYPKDSKSSDFWYNAGAIFEALNDVGSAVYSYNQYYQTSKKSDRHDIFYLIAGIYKRGRNWKRAIENYERFLKTPTSNRLRVMIASFSIAEIYQNKLTNLNLAKTWYQKTLNFYRKLHVGASYGARAHFFIVKTNYYDPFHKLRIPKDPKKQEQVLAKKIQLLQDLEKALKPVIRYNQGEAILASLVLIGKANQEIAQQIEAAPIPKSLGKKGRLQYKAGIKTVIQPYVSKSIEHYRLAIQKSLKLKVYSEWIGEAYKGLAGIQVSKEKFVRFLPVYLIQEAFSAQFVDNTGTVTLSFLRSLTDSLQYNLSKADFQNLSQALESKNETSVLSSISEILNKDIDNVVAINSLAFFYLQKNRLGLARLILSRLADKEKANPVILNNLGIISLKHGKPRSAVALLKQALKINSYYKVAKVNLGNILIQQHDYQNAYSYYKNDYKEIIKNKKYKRIDALSVLNNYSVALTGSQKWKEGVFIFKSLAGGNSPRPKSLFNYSCFLAEKSKRESKADAQEDLIKAKELIEELKLYGINTTLKSKVNKVSKNISTQMKN